MFPWEHYNNRGSAEDDPLFYFDSEKKKAGQFID